MRCLELEEATHPQERLCMPDEEAPSEAEARCPAEKDRGPALAWWFRACCFCYSAVGIDMAWRLGYVACHCAAYPWQLEACLLLLQGCLSFMHDAYFAGRSPAAKFADRCCATFLTMCQPLKLAFCSMDAVQLSLLCCSWTLGLLCFKAGARAFVAGNGRRYQFFHTLWHILLPLGGYLWIEYTRLSVLLLHASSHRHPLLSSEAIWAAKHGAAAEGEDVGTLLLWGPGAAGPDCLQRSYARLWALR
ncbi:DNAH6 [Symbiodinium sp. CCMP2592]|nr:DNAH6 [Symbiodinium sp. CCMP2592]